MKHLAFELQRYYRRARNRLVFRNGMDLNELALEIWSRLNFERMDASALSRVIKGERLFTSVQLSAFSQALKLNTSEQYALKNALGKDILQKYFGVVVPISEYDELVADKHLESMVVGEIRRLKDIGDVREALQISSFFEQMLSSTPQIQESNKIFLVKILNEKVRCFMYLEKPNTYLPKVNKTIVLARRLAWELRDPDLISMAEAHIGGSYYVAGMSLASAQALESSYGKVNAAARVEFIRTLLNNYGFLGDVTSYRRTYNNAMKILSEKNKYNPSHIASMHEALARSLSILGETKKARQFLAQLKTTALETFFQSQILRGRMFVCYQEFLHKGKVDLDEAKSILQYSRKYALFKRHYGQITHMYQQMNYG